jgi:predicted GNAT family acetyltransferase
VTDELTDNAALHRYEFRVDGTLAAFVVYVREGDTITLIHTEVKDQFEGHGVGGRVAKAVLDTARDHGWRVVAACPFIRSYIERHPEYDDLTSEPGGAP